MVIERRKGVLKGSYFVKKGDCRKGIFIEEKDEKRTLYSEEKDCGYGDIERRPEQTAKSRGINLTSAVNIQFYNLDAD